MRQIIKGLKKVIAVWLSGIRNLRAQQDAQYTQFMYNKLPQNAAYTNVREVLSLRVLYRDQWSGNKAA